MKKLLTLALCFTCFSASAFERFSCPKFYMGLSTGINNQSGFLGANFDIPITRWASFGVGAGKGTWGFKGYSEARLYLGECNSKLALGAGASYSTGIKDYNTILPTTGGDAEVKMQLHPSLNAFGSLYYFFNIGPDGVHRFYLQTGYSYPLNTDVYTIQSGHELTTDGKIVMDVLRPGGVVLGFGFSFGLGGGY